MKLTKNTIYKIYEKHYDELLHIAVSLMGNMMDAEDVMHDLAIAIMEKADKVAVANNVKAFLSTAVRNLSKDKYRKNRRENSIALDLLPESIISVTEKGLLSLEERDILKKLLLNYSQGDRDVFLKYFIDGYSTRELAIKLGVKEKTLSQKLLRMRKKIAKEYLLFMIFLFISR